MDQSQLSTMDPKLREAYERIMGMAVQTKTPSATPPQNSFPSQIPTPQSQTLNQPVNVSPLPVTPPVSPTTSNNTPYQPASSPTHTETPSINASNASPSTPTTPHPATFTQPSASSQPSAPTFDPVLANDQIHAYVSEEVKGAKRSIQMIQLVYLIGGLVFLVFYVLFWMKLFNISSPL